MLFIQLPPFMWKLLSTRASSAVTAARPRTFYNQVLTAR
jgi:hypothetical protein